MKLSGNTTLLACFGLLASACSSGEKFGDVYCGEVAKCCSQIGMAGEGQTCRFLFSSVPSNAATDACLADVKARAAAGTFCSDEGASEACEAVFSSGTPSGNKKPGEACEFDSDCAASSEGDVACASSYTDSGWIHKCQVRMRGKAGDACIGTQDGDMLSSSGSGDDDIVPKGYVCNTADGIECSSGTCVALAGVGQSCSFSSDCVRAAFCDTKHQCVNRIAAGGACTGAATDECTDGHYCPEASPRQCAPQAGTGASCSSDAMCKSGDCTDDKCQPGLLDGVGWAMFCS